MSKEYKKPERYVPGPNDPLLPPQLSEFKDKTTDEVLAELNKMPFFMTQLDGSENVELEALKALAYEGEPYEVAGNFKNQGNDLYKTKKYKDARALYTKGIDVKCDDAKINEALFSNRAACELELKNYRRCINDCKEALKLNPMNLKCYFRMGKAFLALDNLEEAQETVDFGLKIDETNVSLQNLAKNIIKRMDEIKANEEAKLKEKQDKENKKIMLESALTLRNVKSITTKEPAELLRESQTKLEDPMDFESQMIYPAIVMYPTTDEFDFIGEVSELTTVQELIDLVMQRPPKWFETEEHKNFSPKKLIAFMETENGGLIKAGKKLTFHDILKKETPSVPLFDFALKIFFVPKVESEEWISKWDKKVALEKRA
ncbi:hsp70/Hsp90 co-chaperone Cns1p [Monosporozyma unispora]|nr:HSP70/90 co-chaperone [Kazachstania unispora]